MTLTKYIVVMYNVYENVIVTQFKHDKVLNRKFFTLFHYKKNIKSSIEIVLLFYHNCNITILVSNSDKLSSHIL
ncbi:hypothetical protein SACN33_11550 [Staphylococcus aureus]